MRPRATASALFTASRHLALPGDDLATSRRRGLPIGNQTSQFFAIVYLDRLHHFVKERLGVRRYLRYVDDIVVCHDRRDRLRAIAEAIEAFCAEHLHLRFNPTKCWIAPVTEGLPLLGYRLWPERIRLASGNVSRVRKRLRRLAPRLLRGSNDVDRVTASVQGWVGHASHADSWRLRERILPLSAARKTLDPTVEPW